MDIIADYKELVFLPSGYFAFDACDEVIHYNPSVLSTNEGRLALLHEISHARLGHFSFKNDFELLIMEAQAWHMTKQLCSKHNVKVNDTYIQSCIDTYDRWLSSRSKCPSCTNFCLPRQGGTFRCFLCGCHWEASTNPHDRVTLTVLSGAQ